MQRRVLLLGLAGGQVQQLAYKTLKCTDLTSICLRVVIHERCMGAQGPFTVEWWKRTHAHANIAVMATDQHCMQQFMAWSHSL